MAAMATDFFDLIVARGLSDSPPARRTRQSNHATLLVSWWCTIFALVIIILRVIGRFVRSEQLFTEDRIMLWSIVPLLGRMGLAHVVLLFGTNNVDTSNPSVIDVQNREIGSKCVLVSRILYALFIWTAKWSVSQFLKRLTSATWNPVYEKVLRAIRIFLAVTFLGVVVGTLAECHPFDHYWQIIPDPGPGCRDGLAQLLTMGISDIITDILLIAFPIPIILQSNMSFRRKISLCLLFMLSGILVAITAVRIASIVHAHELQQRRTLWASIEILAAAAVSNALVIGSFVRDRGSKKQRFRVTASERINSEIGPSINRQMTLQHWGGDSDEDLFRSLGSRLDSAGEIMSIDQNMPRRAPKATDLPSLVVPNGVASPMLRPREEPAPEDFEPQAYAGFLRENNNPATNLRKSISRRSMHAAAMQQIRIESLIARQDFGAIDWAGPHEPESLTLGDAGGLLPASDSPTTIQPIVHRYHDSPGPSPMTYRPRTSFPETRRPCNERNARPISIYSARDAIAARLSGDARRSQVSLAAPLSPRSPHSPRPRSRSRSRVREAVMPEDMELGDAGGLLS